MRIGKGLLLSIPLVAGCGDQGHAPTARITAMPAYLPLDDNYRTDCVLDGTASDDVLDDPTGARPLAFRWTLDDPAPRVTAGGLDQPKVTVRLAATRPTAATLEVTDETGDTGRTTLEVGVTVPP